MTEQKNLYKCAFSHFLNSNRGGFPFDFTLATPNCAYICLTFYRFRDRVLMLRYNVPTITENGCRFRCDSNSSP